MASSVAFVPQGAAPYRPQHHGLVPVLRQFGCLVQTMWTEYRSTWFMRVFFGGLMPLGMLFLMQMVAGGQMSTEQAYFLIGGNMTASICYGPAMQLIIKIGWGRYTRAFDYWTSLPIGKMNLLLAMVAVELIMALPTVLCIYLLGSLMLGVPLQGGWWLLLLIPLGTLSLTGVGAFLGVLAKDGHAASLYSNLLMGVVVFLSPTLVPPDHLPGPLRLTSYLLPNTYAASAFRRALMGHIDTGFLIDMGLLAAMTFASLWLVHKKLDWRS